MGPTDVCVSIIQQRVITYTQCFPLTEPLQFKESYYSTGQDEAACDERDDRRQLTDRSPSEG